MTDKEILEQQVEALEKLLKLRQAVIEELENKVAKLETEKTVYPQWQPYISPPQTTGLSTPCPSDPTGIHSYPTGWLGVNTQCTKCGKYAVSSTITITNSTQQNSLGNVVTLENTKDK